LPQAAAQRKKKQATWQQRPITVSVGAATIERLPAEQAIPGVSAYEAAEFLKRADDALYLSKRRGRNQVVHAALADLQPVV
jgi:GGDEF domain-containing protein